MLCCVGIGTLVLLLLSASSTIENKTLDEISIGDRAELSRTLTERDIDIFAIMSGDVNPAHVDADYAKDDIFHK